MSDDWVNEIRERLEKATPHWIVSAIYFGHSTHSQYLEKAGNWSKEDLNLVANAPTDIANLLKERNVLRNMLHAIQTGWILFRDTQAINDIDKALGYNPMKDEK